MANAYESLSLPGNRVASPNLNNYQVLGLAGFILVWRSRPSQEEEGLVKCLYQACVRHTESGCPRKYAINGVLSKLTTAGRPAGLARV